MGQLLHVGLHNIVNSFYVICPSKSHLSPISNIIIRFAAQWLTTALIS
jgi:hypothetical protein